jgi:serine/threonine-protein kinase
MGRLDEAARTLEKISPDVRGSFWDEYLVEIYLAQGRDAEAAALVPQMHEPDLRTYARALVAARQGSHQAADSALTAFIDGYQDTMAFQIADLYAYRGEPDNAFAWLERAYRQRDEGLASVKSDPKLASLRGDPRFGAFLVKIGLGKD